MRIQKNFQIHPIHFVFWGEDAIVYCIRGKEQGKYENLLDNQSDPRVSCFLHAGCSKNLENSKFLVTLDKAKPGLYLQQGLDYLEKNGYQLVNGVWQKIPK
jgi:hypothetical protein